MSWPKLGPRHKTSHNPPAQRYLNSSPNHFWIPQGRLTPTSGTPVLNATVTNASTLYYTPYVGDIIPLYNGVLWYPVQFTEVSVSLSGTSFNSVYDLFVAQIGSLGYTGSIVLGWGPSWASTTSRGTGAGTTEITRQDGLWVNKNLITLTNGSTTYKIPVKQALYVGTILTNFGVSAMSCTFRATGSGGAGPTFGLSNAYNRIQASVENSDTQAAYTYTSTTARLAGGVAAQNFVNFVDGLQEMIIRVQYACPFLTSGGATAYIGTGVDTTSVAQQQAGMASTGGYAPSMSYNDYTPVLGAHTIYAIESGNTGATFNPAFGQLKLDLWY